MSAEIGPKDNACHEDGLEDLPEWPKESPPPEPEPRPGWNVPEGEEGAEESWDWTNK